jgi:hypothetical protein
MNDKNQEAAISLSSDELSDISGVQVEEVTPRDLLRLGREILGVLALLFVLGATSILIWPNSPVFEACRTILPPIATLVIGYYFGRSK